MILKALLDIPLSVWEERVSAALFLSAGSPAGELLSEDVTSRVTEALVSLQRMPAPWAREVCIEVLLRSEGESLCLRQP
jgi:hypothetical protein